MAQHRAAAAGDAAAMLGPLGMAMHRAGDPGNPFGSAAAMVRGGDWPALHTGWGTPRSIYGHRLGGGAGGGGGGGGIEVPEDATYEQLLQLDERHGGGGGGGRGGLTPAELDQMTAVQTLGAELLQVFERNDDAECKICLEKYSVGDQLRRLVSCTLRARPPQRHAVGTV